METCKDIFKGILKFSKCTGRVVGCIAKEFIIGFSEWCNNIKKTKESADIAKQIIELGILREKSRDDANHIGIAVANELNYIISWNFKHMVNVKTVNGVSAIANLRGYNDIDLVTPTFFLGEE